MNASVTGTALDLDILSGTQDPTHKSDMYVRCQIPADLRDRVMFYKTEPVDPGICDTLHDANYPWVVDTVGVCDEASPHPAYRTLHQKDGEAVSQGLSEDAGLILTFHGKPEGVVALDLNSRREYTEAEAGLFEDQFQTRLPRYTKWGFRIFSIIKTDGPEKRQRLFESQEQQRARSNSDMADSITAAFMNVIAMLKNSGNATLSADAEKLLSPAVAAAATGQPPEDPEVASLRANAAKAYQAAQGDKVGNDAPAMGIDVRNRPRK